MLLNVGELLTLYGSISAYRFLYINYLQSLCARNINNLGMYEVCIGMATFLKFEC